jgi:hypothetical protein
MNALRCSNTVAAACLHGPRNMIKSERHSEQHHLCRFETSRDASHSVERQRECSGY